MYLQNFVAQRQNLDADPQKLLLTLLLKSMNHLIRSVNTIC